MPLLNLKRIPRLVPERFLPGLQLDGFVVTKKFDYTQARGSLVTKPLPIGSVGRVARICDMGGEQLEGRYLIYIRISGHPETNFYAEELNKMKLPRPIRRKK